MEIQIRRVAVALVLICVASCQSLTPEQEMDSESEEEIIEPGWEPIRTVEGEELDDEQIRQLIERLPELEADEADEVSFKRRDESLPPPLTGDDIDGDWPPDLSDPAAQPAPDGPLTVQAFRPTGEVRPPFQVALAFDRPVVEVGAVGTQDISKFEISPEIDGRWRWLGTQTVVFEPEDRWPMATEFEIAAGQGLQSIDGARLEEAHRFEFSTPPPEVQAIYPRHNATSQATDAPVAVVFNQAIDEASLDAISVRQESPGRELSMRPVSGEELTELLERWRLEEAHEEGRVIALAPEQDYDGDARVRISVDGPLQSAEGPVVGMEGDSSSFSVRGPFRLSEVECGWGNNCNPTSPIYLRFSNPIHEDAGDEHVEIQPAVDDLSVTSAGARMTLVGDFQPRTDYTITVSEELSDVFDQQIVGDRSGEVEIGPYSPLVAGPQQNLLIRPIGSAQSLPIRVAEIQSVRVRIFDVSPGDWDEFQGYFGRRDVTPDLEEVDRRTLEFSESERRQNREVRVDYSAAFDGEEPGHAVVIVDQPDPWRGGSNTQWAYWVQQTDLSADLSSDQRDLSAQVTSIADGSAIAEATLRAGSSSLAQTDSSGETEFSVPRGASSQQPIVVEKGDDSLLIPVDGHTRWFGGQRYWSHRDIATNALWYIVDDRQTYKPGETVRIRGWLRTLEDSPRSEPTGLSGDEIVQYYVREPRRNEIEQGEAEVDRFGGFELEFEVPDEANLGTATIEFRTTVDGSNHRHRHQVQFQEFRRPEYEVTLSSDEGPHLPQETTSWDAEALYYAGGAVAGVPTSWRFSESSAEYQPAGWQGWSFGEWSVWWSPWHRGGASQTDNQVLPEEFSGTNEGQTDGQGRDTIKMQFDEPERGFARRVQGTVSVTDVNRQSWEATESVLVHPSSLYVGLRSEANFINREESWDVEAVVVDIDGEIVEDRSIDFAVSRRRGDSPEVDDCRRQSGEEPVSCSFSGLSPGSYELVASVEDDQGRVSESELTFWVAGRDTSGAETAEEDELLLIPATDEFAVGDTAQLFVQAPYYPLAAVVELRRDGRYERRQVTVSEDDPTIDIDIEESMLPNVHVRMTALGMGDGYAMDNFASGSIELDIDRGPRSLDVNIEPGEQFLAPGADADVDIEVLNASGEPVEDAQVFLFAVDESVLALSSYELLDPLATFYPTRGARMSDIRSRSWLLLDGDEALEETTPGRGAEMGRRAAPAPGGAPAEVDMMMMEADEPMPEGAQATGADEAIELREVFDALAFYRSDLVTDADGRVSVTESMPDSLTRYRLMAVAVEGDRHFGTGEEDVTVRKPLMVRPSPPRFLNVGDSFEFPVVVHNRSDEARTVDLAMRATSGLEWLQGPGRRFEVAADERVEVRIAARATSAGTTRVQVAASSDELSDAELVTFPVLTPATTEAFATYGSIGADDDDAVLQGIKVPADAYTEYGGLEVSASSTQLQALTDAFIYLTNYRFNCSEQLASRILSVIALYDVLDAFEAAELPEPQELRASMDLWIEELIQMQRGDGGFGFWPGARKSSPFASVHSLLALWRAGEEGYDVPSHVHTRGTRYLENISQHIQDYHPRAAAAVEAYSLHLRHRMGEVQRRHLDNYLGRHGVEELPLEALGWLLPIAEGTQFEERFLQRITGQVQETAATAEFQETYPSQAHRILHTTRRTDGVVLDGLMRVDPDHVLIEKVARGLLSHRSRGRWANTQENVFILKALRRYFDLYEEVEPDFVARAWLGDDQIAEHGFHGRTTERYSAKVPMAFLQENIDSDAVVLQRDGQGRMYYRLGINYAPKSRHLPAHNEGFSVERNYEAIDDDGDVRRTDDGWEVKAGARVRVELTMAVPARRYHVALVDWLPAGFEPINPALDTSAVESELVGASTERGRWGWWGWPWFEHQNLRDERVEAFSSLVSEGVHTYSYVARATTPGEFIAMPAKAEEMYHPETFGRSSTEIVSVVD